MQMHKKDHAVMSRRRWLGLTALAGAAVALVSLPLRVFAAGRAAFEATAMDAALTELFGGRKAENSDRIKFQIPDIAENGAVVPVSVATDLDDVKTISIVVDKNPNPLVARFTVTPDVAADVSARIKMGQSSTVRAFVETGTGLYTVSREVKVTIGGCGG